MSRFTVILTVFACVMGLLSVAADAFASHGLVAVAPTMEQAVVWFKEATKFQMNHALGLLIATFAAERLEPGRPRTLIRAAAVAMAAGTVLFPGALYSISFSGPGFFAPWGGYAVMIGWILFAVGAVMAMTRPRHI